MLTNTLPAAKITGADYDDDDAAREASITSTVSDISDVTEEEDEEAVAAFLWDAFVDTQYDDHELDALCM